MSATKYSVKEEEKMQNDDSKHWTIVLLGSGIQLTNRVPSLAHKK